jgi:peptide chain release factor 1
MIQEETDDEMRELAKEELNELLPQLSKMEEDIKILLVPKDEEDTRDVYIEVRSGTGGDEASLFAGDLLRMYSRYADRVGWKWEIVEENTGTAGGYNKAVMEVHGDNVYGMLKFESGVHRVQRVPETEAKGRVHTSAATVAILPILEIEDVHINKADLKIDVFRASGAGGQHVNRTESAVRITHNPTGIVVECQEARSQIKNREIAMTKLFNLIQEKQRSEVEGDVASHRRSLIGSGDRSDKIRTYNFPQNRITDHRIDLTVHNLSDVLEGNMTRIIEELRMAETADKMQAMDEI